MNFWFVGVEALCGCGIVACAIVGAVGAVKSSLDRVVEELRELNRKADRVRR